MSGALLGQLAALGAAACWTFTSLLFTFAGHRVGSQVVNLARLLLALVILALAHRTFAGEWLPLWAGPERWGWLALSGLIGLALGDAALFQALLFIGPRLSTLLMALAPIIATLAARIFLGERLALLDLLAVFLTVGGVAWVVAERQPSAAAPAGGRAGRPRFALGVALGVAAATGQALGLITSRLGMAGDFPVLSATVIRMLAAAAAVWLAALMMGRAGRPLRVMRREPRAALLIATATLLGPVAGASLSLVAIQNAPIGIASTLMALTPVLILPFGWCLFKERVSLRSVAGTVVALAGVALIFLA
ncbi:MAG: DMT family transporter [Anaerolineales bacterium]|nr:DMT family transporter [Anaerolineales bacterium]